MANVTEMTFAPFFNNDVGAVRLLEQAAAAEDPLERLELLGRVWRHQDVSTIPHLAGGICLLQWARQEAARHNDLIVEAVLDRFLDLHDDFQREGLLAVEWLQLAHDRELISCLLVVAGNEALDDLAEAFDAFCIARTKETPLAEPPDDDDVLWGARRAEAPSGEVRWWCCSEEEKHHLA